MAVMIENIFAVRAHLVDGSCVDLLLFADPDRASEYAKSLLPLPTGFDFLEVVDRRVIGDVVERRLKVRSNPVVVKVKP